MVLLREPQKRKEEDSLTLSVFCHVNQKLFLFQHKIYYKTQLTCVHCLSLCRPSPGLAYGSGFGPLTDIGHST